MMRMNYITLQQYPKLWSK